VNADLIPLADDLSVSVAALDIPTGEDITTTRKLPPLATTLSTAKDNGWLTHVAADNDAVRVTVSWPMDQVVAETTRIHQGTSLRSPALIRMTVLWWWNEREQAYRWRCNDQAGWGKGCDAIVLRRESDTIVTADPYRVDRRISLKDSTTPDVIGFRKLLAEHGPEKVADLTDDAAAEASSPWRQVVRENVAALVTETHDVLTRFDSEVRTAVDHALATGTPVPPHPERDEALILLTALASGDGVEGMDETGKVRHAEDRLVVAAEALLNDRHAGRQLLDLIHQSGLRLSVEHR